MRDSEIHYRQLKELFAAKHGGHGVINFFVFGSKSNRYIIQ